ncbi:MAG: glycoside hydrolase family 28 protein [Candidatus Dadabacteria bacterium]
MQRIVIARSLLFAGLILPVFILSTGYMNSLVKKFTITHFGAVPDGTTLNTKAIQKTIDVCSENGGGEVIIPKGVFVSGAIFLKKGVALRIDKEGVLKGSVNRSDYPQVKTRWEGTEMMYMAALVNADGLVNVKISGDGTIDGSGDVWRQNIANRIDTATIAGRRWERPRLVCIQNCNDVELSGLRLHNQAVWCVHILYCKDVDIDGLDISADHNIPSSDGIDIDSSKDVEIRKCHIDVNDDCISIKSGKDEDGLRVNRPSEDILVKNCHFGYGHGGVAMGSETSGGIRNVLIKDCLADAGNWAPIRFKSQPSRGGVVENIRYENIKLNGTRKAVEFNMAWRMVPPVKPPARILPVVRNVQLMGLVGNVNTVGDIHGLEGSPIIGVTFRNCKLSAEKGLLIEHARKVDLSGLTMEVKQGEPVINNDVE